MQIINVFQKNIINSENVPLYSKIWLTVKSFNFALLGSAPDMEVYILKLPLINS